MEIREKIFKAESEKYGFDDKYRATINHNIKQYEKSVKKGVDFYKSLDKAKLSASLIKDYTLNNLDKLLIL